MEDYLVLSFISLNFLCIECNRLLLPKLEGWEKGFSMALLVVIYLLQFLLTKKFAGMHYLSVKKMSEASQLQSMEANR